MSTKSADLNFTDIAGEVRLALENAISPKTEGERAYVDEVYLVASRLTPDWQGVFKRLRASENVRRIYVVVGRESGPSAAELLAQLYAPSDQLDNIAEVRRTFAIGGGRGKLHFPPTEDEDNILSDVRVFDIGPKVLPVIMHLIASAKGG